MQGNPLGGRSFIQAVFQLNNIQCCHTVVILLEEIVFTISLADRRQCPIDVIKQRFGVGTKPTNVTLWKKKNLFLVVFWWLIITLGLLSVTASLSRRTVGCGIGLDKGRRFRRTHVPNIFCVVQKLRHGLKLRDEVIIFFVFIRFGGGFAILWRQRSRKEMDPSVGTTVLRPIFRQQRSKTFMRSTLRIYLFVGWCRGLCQFPRRVFFEAVHYPSLWVAPLAG